MKLRRNMGKTHLSPVPTVVCEGVRSTAEKPDRVSQTVCPGVDGRVVGAESLQMPRKQPGFTKRDPYSRSSHLPA